MWRLVTGPSGGMADAEVSKTSDFGRVSSSLTSGTILQNTNGGRSRRPLFVYVSQTMGLPALIPGSATVRPSKNKREPHARDGRDYWLAASCPNTMEQRLLEYPVTAWIPSIDASRSRKPGPSLHPNASHKPQYITDLEPRRGRCFALQRTAGAQSRKDAAGLHRAFYSHDPPSFISEGHVDGIGHAHGVDGAAVWDYQHGWTRTARRWTRSQKTS